MKELHEEVHERLEKTTFDGIQQMQRRFGLRSAGHYSETLRAGVSRPCVSYKQHPDQKWVSPSNSCIPSLLGSNWKFKLFSVTVPVPPMS
ncbi:hypothetical protein HPB48_021017 [Haemaphysalis longicornis]|uniref:Uncharacterized protein n=1 Tax=Haemaphysalis longicornis TaxID=44386 RepID=A0A9J6H5B7_HAELO|nr:hypothetical protein HPB48_021017 [Haemaphysalis longicornis]